MSRAPFLNSCTLTSIAAGVSHVVSISGYKAIHVGSVTQVADSLVPGIIHAKLTMVSSTLLKNIYILKTIWSPTEIA